MIKDIDIHIRQRGEETYITFSGTCHIDPEELKAATRGSLSDFIAAIITPPDDSAQVSKPDHTS